MRFRDHSLSFEGALNVGVLWFIRPLLRVNTQMARNSISCSFMFFR